MTFEEDFPSLKREKDVSLVSNDITLIDDDIIISKSVLIKKCLDKQKVKDAIMKLRKKNRKDEDLEYPDDIYYKDLLKELGL